MTHFQCSEAFPSGICTAANDALTKNALCTVAAGPNHIMSVCITRMG